MKKYDVVIVGAGPSGLRCAEKLADSKLSILLLEKKSIVGDKICAGGITRKSYKLMKFPDEIIEHKVDMIGLHSENYHNDKKLPEPFIYTVNRHTFGKWQLNRLKGLDVTYRNNSTVTTISDHSITINNEEEIEFKYLVGADGPNSLVRRHLKIPVEKVLATVQYIIPSKDQTARMEIYLDNRYFHSWYAWSFPHEDSISVGACCDPKYMSGKKLKENIHNWLEAENYDITEASNESYPISYDYRGFQFGNIFLAGEAAGLASGLTGEGIYQSLVSGEEIAGKILDKNYSSKDFRFILKYNRIQYKFMRFTLSIGPLRSHLADLIVLAMRNKWVNRKILNGFS